MGVYVSNTLKPSLNCLKAAKKAMSALKLIKMAFNSLTKANFKTLYSVYVRPHIEHCIQATGPYLIQDLKALEKVQRRATKLVCGLHQVPYEERLRILELTSVEERIRRGDLIETYKILSHQSGTEEKTYFARYNAGTTRGHNRKLKVNRTNTLLRLKFFSNRVVQPWNKLPQDVVTAANLNEFKNRLDKFMTTKTLSSLFHAIQ